jgi:hypothetical protein
MCGAGPHHEQCGRAAATLESVTGGLGPVIARCSGASGLGWTASQRN